jgi:hypothetical protein
MSLVSGTGELLAKRLEVVGYGNDVRRRIAKSQATNAAFHRSFDSF